MKQTQLLEQRAVSEQTTGFWSSRGLWSKAHRKVPALRNATTPFSSQISQRGQQNLHLWWQIRGHAKLPTDKVTHMINQGTRTDSLREQRAIIRTLRKNYPDGERRIALTDGAVAKYGQGTHKGKMFEVYELPCDEFQCNIDLLHPSVIDPQATRALWLQDPLEDEEPPPHWHWRIISPVSETPDRISD